MPDYPSISFKTKTILPPEQVSEWRSTIGIVGEFSKGPSDALSVNPQTFSQVYGIDSSSGSIAVQQALSLGATDFVIARAVPTTSPSITDISFGSANPSNLEPIIGSYVTGDTDFNYKTDKGQTLGLRFSVNYIGSPLIVKETYSSVVTKPYIVKSSSFVSEKATARIYVTDFVAGTNDSSAIGTGTLTITTKAQSENGYQIVTISKSDTATNAIEAQAGNLKPGNVIFLGDIELQILSKPFSVSTSNWGVLVKNIAGATTEVSDEGWAIKYPQEDSYILGYSTVTESGEEVKSYTASTKYMTLPSESYQRNDGSFVQLDAYTVFNPGLESSDYINFGYYTVPESYQYNEAVALSVENFGNDHDNKEGIFYKFGTDTSTSRVGLLLDGEFWIPFASGSVTLGNMSSSDNALPLGTKGSSLVNDISNGIYGDNVVRDLINEVKVTNTLPYTLSLTSAFGGNEANRIKYKVERNVSDPACSDLLIKIDSTTFGVDDYTSDWASMLYGIDGPKSGERYFYNSEGERVILVRAKSPGATNIYVSISYPVYSGGAPTFTLEVRDQPNGPIIESSLFDLSNIDLSTGLLTQSDDLIMVEVLYVGPITGLNVNQDLIDSLQLPTRVAPPLSRYSSKYNTGDTALANSGSAYLKNIQLLDGKDFTYIGAPPMSLQQVTINGYTSAIKKLESKDVAFVIIAGLPYGSNAYSSVFNLAIEQAKTASVETGLRQLFLEAPRNMSPSQAYNLSSTIDSEYVSLINGTVNYALENGQVARDVGVTGYYAGIMSSRPPYISPHAPYDALFPGGILSTRQELTPESKNQLSRGRVDSIYFDRGIGRWKFLNGLTTSSDSTKRYNSVVRLRLQVMSNLQDYLQWILSQPNTRALQRRVETQVNAYMQSKLQEGWFLRVGDIICNESNNSEADMARGKLYLDISYVPIVPADYVFVSLNEDYTLLDSLEFNTRPS